MLLRLEPADDYLHVPEDAQNYNESRYYNFFDGAGGFGGWVRLGNRVHEGHAELSVCLYLPDGRVGFTYARPKITDNDAHDAGGLRFEVLEPFVAHRIDYDGRVCVLDHPGDMAEPREAFANNPHLDAAVELRLDAVGPVHGGEPVPEPGEEALETDPEKMFARGHTEQHMAVTGTVRVGDETFTLADGLGMRDHSWGPRYWQNIWFYRWCTVNLGPDLGMGVTIAGDEAGRVGARGFVYDRARYGDDRTVDIRDATIEPDYGDDWVPASNRLTVTTDDHTYVIDGQVWSHIPLRNRRDGLVTRIGEGATRWSGEGLVGTGMSEYLDQIVDGVPVGTRHGC